MGGGTGPYAVGTAFRLQPIFSREAAISPGIALETAALSWCLRAIRSVAGALALPRYHIPFCHSPLQRQKNTNTKKMERAADALLAPDTADPGSLPSSRAISAISSSARASSPPGFHAAWRAASYAALAPPLEPGAAAPTLTLQCRLSYHPRRRPGFVYFCRAAQPRFM